MTISGKKPVTIAERQTKHREPSKADEQELRNENLQLRRQSERLTSKSSLETEERRHVLINAVRRVGPSVSPKFAAAAPLPWSRAPCSPRRATNWSILNLWCGTTPRGGVSNFTGFRRRDRRGCIFLAKRVEKGT
jgi:hypothetical protein